LTRNYFILELREAGDHIQMRYKLNIVLLVGVLITLLVSGIFYFSNEPAESRQSLDLSFVEVDFEQGLIAFSEQESNSDILLAQKNCGNETCSDKECCCLNTETGAKCCRPLVNRANCVEACKKSKPC